MHGTTMKIKVFVLGTSMTQAYTTKWQRGRFRFVLQKSEVGPASCRLMHVCVCVCVCVCVNVHSWQRVMPRNIHSDQPSIEEQTDGQVIRQTA